MSPFLIPILALSIPLLALIGNMFVKPWFEHRARQQELDANKLAEKAAQYAAQTERLEQRMQVLERIITDRGLELSDEIERLRDRPLN